MSDISLPAQRISAFRVAHLTFATHQAHRLIDATSNFGSEWTQGVILGLNSHPAIRALLAPRVPLDLNGLPAIGASLALFLLPRVVRGTLHALDHLLTLQGACCC